MIMGAGAPLDLSLPTGMIWPSRSGHYCRSKKAIQHDINTRQNNRFGGKDIPAFDEGVSRQS